MWQDWALRGAKIPMSLGGKEDTEDKGQKGGKGGVGVIGKV